MNKIPHLKSRNWIFRDHLKEEKSVEKIMELTNGIGADYAFECYGNVNVQGQCYNALRNKGKAIFIGSSEHNLNEIPIMVQRL